MTDQPIKRGHIWLVEFPPPEGSEPGNPHPVLILQINEFNRSYISTIIGIVITSSLHREYDPGNVRISSSESGLSQDSVVNVSQIMTFDKETINTHLGTLCPEKMDEVMDGVRLVLGL
jgi:mRNA interferase MazF